MLFHSPKNAAFRVICSIQRDKRHPVTGDVIETVPGVTAEFGKLGAQYDYTDPLTGATSTGADISGHYFDSDLEAVEKNWDADTKEMVERKLLGLCRTQPDRVVLIEREAAKAALPWPTYDSLDAAGVLQLAPALGLVEEALAYERENRDRPTIIDGLTAEDTVVDESDDEPAPAPPVQTGEKVGEPLLRTISV